MKVTKSISVTTHLELNYDEANWLKKRMQNYTPMSESAEDEVMIKKLLNCLSSTFIEHYDEAQKK